MQIGMPHFSFLKRTQDETSALHTVEANSPIEISRGNVPGASGFSAFGKLVTSGGVTKNIIWPNGTFTFPDQVTGEDVSFVSTSAQDAVGGTGASEIEVHYLDANLLDQSVTITLTGQTPVTGQLSGCRFIQCMHITEVGTDVAANGTISAYRATDNTVEFSLISAGDERCTSSMRMVPASKLAYVAGAVGSSVSGTSASTADIELWATELDNDQYLNPFIQIPHGSIGVQDNGVAFNFPLPLVFRAGTIIGMRVSTDKAATVSADWFGWLEDA
ncbi:MAG: hypothetical protein R3254_07430 [Thiomicrorhabdus sp.]|nr:hypothetical protein [Thiomicrorhabdus sp.]